MQSSAVVLTVPAETSYVSLVRTGTAAMCAQADFPVDTLDDLCLAVDEACALAIAGAPAGTGLTVTFRVAGTDLAVDVAAASASGLPPRTNTFAWTVLTALVDRVEAQVSGGVLQIHLHAHGVAETP